MPAEIYGEKYPFLPRPELLTFEEIERLARLFVDLGVRKIRVTGGEPLLRAELPKLIEGLAAIEGLEDLTLTTNGTLLASRAQALKDAGLRRVTVSLDSHDEAIFRRMSGRGVGPGRVLEGIEAADKAGLRPIKINCVVQRGGNEDAPVALARFFKGSGHVLRFIEFMDVGTLNDWDLAKVVEAPDYRGEVARRYRYRDGSGEIGVITSVSAPFCGDCTRARLTTDGKLVTCLFAAGGTDLRGPLRAGASDDDLRESISAVWRARSDRYSEERSAHTDLSGRTLPRSRIEMYQIGG
jgi:cyclic pyranopterin phosphate synthase